MLDPGASAFLSGHGPFQRLLNHYRDIGYPADSIKMTRGRRRFQFGGDASQWSDWSAHIPVFVDGKFGTIEIFLLPGNTPMLCGRPIIEALGMSMDFAQRRLRIGSSPWQSATLGRQGEYLWPITQEHDLMHYDRTLNFAPMSPMSTRPTATLSLTSCRLKKGSQAMRTRIVILRLLALVS